MCALRVAWLAWHESDTLTVGVMLVGLVGNSLRYTRCARIAPMVRAASPRGRQREGARRPAPPLRKAPKKVGTTRVEGTAAVPAALRCKHVATCVQYVAPEAREQSFERHCRCDRRARAWQSAHRRLHGLIDLNVTRVASKPKRPPPSHINWFLKKHFFQPNIFIA